MSRPIRAVALVGVVAIAAACGGSTGPSSSDAGGSPTAATSASPATSGSPATSASPSASASAGTSPAASGVAPSASAGTGGAQPSGDVSIGSAELAALQAQIPDRIEGVALRTMSFTAADLADAGIDPALGAGISAVAPDLLNSAVAIGISTNMAQPLVVTLVDVPRGSADELESAFAARMREVNRGDVTVRERTVAGTEVIEVNAGSDSLGTVLWADGTTLHVVQSVDAGLRTAAVEALAD
ncbi:MAG TPA: hypothetical protein VFK54_01295 [Candidatus Limnocylindrales bacterium]|nr:hypothetical protein [Candidatus Limnocylindrales bacterium]